MINDVPMNNRDLHVEKWGEGEMHSLELVFPLFLIVSLACAFLYCLINST